MARDILGARERKGGTTILPRMPGESKRSHRRADEIRSAGRLPLDATIETRLNLIMVASRVISSVKKATFGSRHLRQDPGHVCCGGFMPPRKGRSEMIRAECEQ